MIKDIQLTKTIANIITINAQTQAIKYNTTVDKLFQAQDILDLAKYSIAGSINNQGLTTALEELAKNFENNNSQSTDAQSSDSQFESPFGHFDSAIDFEDASSFKDSFDNVSEANLNENKKQTLQDIINKFNLIQTTDKGALAIIVDKILANFPSQVGEYKSGKVQLLGFLVGQCMKEAKGQGNPKIFNEIVVDKLK